MPLERVTIRGGKRLVRFLAEAQTLTRQSVLEAVAAVLRTEVVPKLRAQVPRRTGKLARSIRVTVRGGFIELRGVFYGRFQTVGAGTDTIAERLIDLIRQSLPRIKALAAAKIRERVRSLR